MDNMRFKIQDGVFHNFYDKLQDSIYGVHFKNLTLYEGFVSIKFIKGGINKQIRSEIVTSVRNNLKNNEFSG